MFSLFPICSRSLQLCIYLIFNILRVMFSPSSASSSSHKTFALNESNKLKPRSDCDGCSYSKVTARIRIKQARSTSSPNFVNVLWHPQSVYLHTSNAVPTYKVWLLIYLIWLLFHKNDFPCFALSCATFGSGIHRLCPTFHRIFMWRHVRAGNLVVLFSSVTSNFE